MWMSLNSSTVQKVTYRRRERKPPRSYP
jgi:hypothetical protein